VTYGHSTTLRPSKTLSPNLREIPTQSFPTHPPKDPAPLSHLSLGKWKMEVGFKRKVPDMSLSPQLKGKLVFFCFECGGMQIER
jgi:hypothetical protein